jgi:hypothetical protein
MLGHRRDHDIAGTQPQPAGQVLDGFGRVRADDRDITRIWPAPGEGQRGELCVTELAAVIWAVQAPP